MISASLILPLSLPLSLYEWNMLGCNGYNPQIYVSIYSVIEGLKKPSKLVRKVNKRGKPTTLLFQT